MSNIVNHVPVLLNEVIDYMNLEKGMVIVDCTIGSGGHAEKILEKIGDNGRLIGIDMDIEALRKAKLRLSNISDSFRLFQANYGDIETVLLGAGINNIDGALFDLGISSLQLETAERGFSIKADGPLDMRMDQRRSLEASDIVNDYPEKKLKNILEKYGDERFAGRIARRIVTERKRGRIKRTRQLADIVASAVPSRYRFRKIHPATKVFMAIRIAVNNELGGLESGISGIMPFLRHGSRLCIISFHSIEDRIAKNALKKYSGIGTIRIITRKPVRPGENEIRLNPRSRSAKLRVAEKIQP